MGFMDYFTSDSPLTVKQPDYYEMVKEAAKAELITNAVNAEVPGYYIQAMITGKKPDFLNTLDATNSAIMWGRKQSGRNRKRGNTT